MGDVIEKAPVAGLPTSTNREDWSEEERAVIEAAGLVFIHQYGESKGARVLAPRPVIARFFHTCERTGLDPLARQIYCIGRAGRDGIEWSIQTGIDGFRVIAERSKLYAGQDDPEWLTESGEWVQAFVKAKHGAHPLAARVRVYRHDWDRPMTGIATWDEYVQTKRDGSPTSMWEQRGPGQLAKCAESLAMRKAFPQDLSGLYTDDEMRGGISGEVLEVQESGNAPAGARSRVAQLAPVPEPQAPVVDEPETVVVAEIDEPEVYDEPDPDDPVVGEDVSGWAVAPIPGSEATS
ncbi:phage recombination protein Bet [Microbacterium trichothecenolyticum]|uniref:phage recombination protein Bet n=1 Tax=Microbacterium trichothecenolyticum TaxID=69370 RepID=UPI0035BE6A58